MPGLYFAGEVSRLCMRPLSSCFASADVFTLRWCYVTLLDFGCGFGDLYQYITTNKLNIRYSGIDINDALIQEGLRIHDGIDLQTKDYLNCNSPDIYDYIVASGVHNLKLEDNWAFIEKTFEVFAS